MQEEAAAFVLQISWSKTKIMQFSNPDPSSTVHAADRLVAVANSFVYLGSMIDSSCVSRGERDPTKDRSNTKLHELVGKRYLEVHY